MTKTIFCAAEQADTEHVSSVDRGGDIVFTCNCGRFVKFPRGSSLEDVDKYIEAHKSANEGQIAVDTRFA